MLNPLARSLEELRPEGFMNETSCAIILRTALLASTVCIAFLLPFFGKHAPFLLFSETWQELCLSVKEAKRFKYRVARNDLTPWGSGCKRLSRVTKDPSAHINALFGFQGHLASVHGHVSKDPFVSFLSNVTHCEYHHALEVPSSLSWNCGCHFFAPGSYFSIHPFSELGIPHHYLLLLSR